VLFLNHTGLVGGAERCLLDLLAELDGDVEPLVACPPGPLLDEVSALGIARRRIIGTAGSLRLHPLGTPRALAELGATAAAVRLLASRRRIDLIHANSLRSALVACAARVAGGPPVAAFVHDVLPAGRAAEASARTVCSQASLLLANSAYAAKSFGIRDDDRRRSIVYNPIDLEAFDPARHPRARARRELGLDADDLVLAIVAQITPWKGQRDAIEILDALRAVRPDARLIVAGETKFVSRATRYDNRAYLSELHRLTDQRGLNDRVRWLGERSDVPAILAGADIVLAPSWQEPFGRIVVEAMAMGCLVAATAVGGPAEVVTDGVDGLLLAPREPGAWARVLAELLDKPGAIDAMRARAPLAARRFDRASFARNVQAGYTDALRYASD